MKLIPSVSVKTTAQCNLACPDCSSRAWMKESHGYRLTLGQVERFIRVCLDSDYRIRRLVFSGGEPSLWEPLLTAAKMIRDSGIALHVTITTNAVLFIRSWKPRDLEELLGAVDSLRVSFYGGFNEAEAHALLRADHRKVAIGVRGHYGQPRQPVPGSLPAECTCPSICLYGNRIDLCPSPRLQYAMIGEPMPDGGGESTPVAWDFLNKLNVGGRLNRPFCSRCISNRKVADQMPLRFYWRD